MGTIKKSSFFMIHMLAISALSLILLSGDVCRSYGDDTPGVTDKSVKIGIIGAVTGPAAEVWVPGAAGVRAYLKMLNEKGGVHGRKINMILEDDRYTIPLALSCFKKLIYRDKVFAMLGASGVGHTAAIIPLVEKEKIPLFAGTTEERFYFPARKYIFSPTTWYEDQAKLVVEYIFNDLKLKDPTIALVYPDAGSGKDTRDMVRELMKVYPAKTYKEVVYTMGSLDFTSEVLSLKRSKPDFILMHGYIIDTAALMKAAKRFKMSTPVLVTQYGSVDRTVEVAGRAAEGLLVINSFGTWDEASPGVNMLRKVSLKYYPDTPQQGPNFFQGWFFGVLFHLGFENAGRNLTRETYLKGLESTKNFDTKGICGVISFGPDDHKSIEENRFFKADTDKKKFIPYTEWRKPKKYDF